jgi:hypothetical protein
LSRSRVGAYLILLALLLNLTNLLPVLQSPFLGDDAWRESCIRGVASLTNTTLGEISWSATKDFIRDGRWYPLVVYYYATFYYLDLFSYKATEVGFVLINILIFSYLVQLVARRKSFFLMTLLVAPIVFQFRFYHDPILSYYYLMQLEFLLLNASLIFFIWFLGNYRRVNLILSIVLFTLALLVYEAFYSFFAMYALVAYTQLGSNQKKLIIKFTAPFFLVALVNVGITLVIRAYFHTSYEGTTLSLQFWPWFTAFCKQVLASVPLSYFYSFGRSDQLLGYIEEHLLSQVLVITAFWMTLWCFAWDFTSREESKVRGERLKDLGIVGLGFWILPAILVTLSAKYQRELKWGLGYLPVYVSSFGLLMLLMMVMASMDGALKRMKRFSRRTLVIATALLGGTLVGLNFTHNNIVVQGYNDAEHYHWSLMKEALEEGLMKGLEEGSFIVFGPPVRSWDEAAFYRMYSGLTLQVVKPPGFEMDNLLGSNSYKAAFQDYLIDSGSPCVYDFMRSTVPKTKFAGYSAEFEGTQGVVVRRNVKPNNDVYRPNVFFVKYEAEARDLGYVALAHLTKLKTVDEIQVSAVADSIRIYVRTPERKANNRILISGNWIDPVSMKITGALLLGEKDLSLVAAGNKGKILEFPRALVEKGVDPNSIVATLTMFGD